MRQLSCLTIAVLATLTTACNSERASNPSESDPLPNISGPLENLMTINGSVIGLVGQAVISLNRKHHLTLSTTESFQFEGTVEEGFAYELRVEEQPEDQFCQFNQSEVGVVYEPIDLQLTCTDLMAVTITFDRDGDGIPDIRRKEFVNVQGLPVKTMVDRYAMGVYDDIATFNYNFDKNRTSYHWDPDGDGKYPAAQFYYYDSNGNRILTESDVNGDGSINETIESTYNFDYPFSKNEEITKSISNGDVESIKKETFTECGNSVSIDSNGDGQLIFSEGESAVTWQCQYEKGQLVQQVKAENDEVVYKKEITISNEPGTTVIVTEEFDAIVPGTLSNIPHKRKEEIYDAASNKILSSIEWRLSEQGGLYIYSSGQWEYHSNGVMSFYRYQFSPENWTNRITETDYNQEGKRTRIIVKEADNLENLQETTYEFSENRMVQTIIDYEDNATTTNTYTYYSSGRKKSVVKEFDYGSNGVVTSRKTTKFLDAGTTGLIKSSATDDNADGSIDVLKSYTYNSNFILTEYTYERNGEILESNQFDDSGKVLRLLEIDFDGTELVKEQSYDAEGRISEFSYFKDGVLERRDSYQYNGNNTIDYQKLFVCKNDTDKDWCLNL